MTLLLDAARIDDRRAAARGALAPLVSSLAVELERVIAADPRPAEVKARLTRAGGRCPRDGAWLAFDPFAPRAHRCPTCSTVYDDDAHWRWWVMWYQLWLAERAVHASALHLLAGDARHAAFAARVLDAFADRYLGDPNEDNVLGPSRPFFSTYLESIWLLQLTIAVDLLEAADAPGATQLGARLRDRVVEPSRALIAGFHEGRSNRQVWNGAALLAAARLLGDGASVDRLVHGDGGLRSQLDGALLADGTWYEGENYHQFAHRGLWYAVTLAERAGAELPETLRARFAEGFAAPLLTALPDLTLPARRDSQWAISLRQWRWAESFELGLARGDDPRLAAALARLYDDPAPRRDTGRWRSAAEAERNEPASALSRADLGWRALLHARAELPTSGDWSPASVLLPAQGIAVLRRDRGRLWTALDYGHAGGGHGHPDRLNLLLVDGAARWLDDSGTGSYVERSLHWYRSTLAHNAPLVDGRSQPRIDGALRAFDERGDAGWVDAEAEIAPGVRARRSLMAMADYVVDRLEWEADREVTLDLPLHADGAPEGLGAWHAADAGGAGGLEDGFDFLDDVRSAEAPARVVRLALAPPPHSDAPAGTAWVHATAASAWFRATAPGAPGQGTRAFVFVRSRGAEGVVATVWDVRGAVRDVGVDGGEIVVTLAGGVDRHRAGEATWRIDGAVESIVLGGAVARDAVAATTEAPAATPGDDALVLARGGDPRRFALAEDAYRRTEAPWADAGRPRAVVKLAVVDGAGVEDGPALVVDAEVTKTDPLSFSPVRAENDLDNEHPDVNSDGVQLHLRRGEEPPMSWLLVPDPATGAVRATPRAGGAGAIPVAASWSPVAGGYRLRASLPLSSLGPGDAALPLALAIVVNEMPPWRERRRGQLVLGGAAPGFAYLQGDRLDPDRFVRVRIDRGSTASSPRSHS